MPRTKNPMSKTNLPEYHSWIGMVQRCRLANNPMHFRFYISRGIKVCKRWNNSFENFWADMGRKPSPMHSNDRINNDGNYEPGNCRWATRNQQARNRKSTKLSESDVLTIRLNALHISQHQLAKLYDVNQSHISKIISGKQWNLTGGYHAN